jgi:hypothetical protein
MPSSTLIESRLRKFLAMGAFHAERGRTDSD